MNNFLPNQPRRRNVYKVAVAYAVIPVGNHIRHHPRFQPLMPRLRRKRIRPQPARRGEDHTVKTGEEMIYQERRIALARAGEHDTPDLHA